MNPDTTPPQPGTPVSLPPLPMPTAAPGPLPATPLPGLDMPVAGLTPAADSAQATEQLKLLIRQYGTNPHAFSGPFQQLKAKYLLEHHQIQPNLDKN